MEHILPHGGLVVISDSKKQKMNLKQIQVLKYQMTSCLSENLTWQFSFMLSKSHLAEMLIFGDKNLWDLGLVEKDNNYIHSLEKLTHHYPQITMTITLLGPFNKQSIEFDVTASCKTTM